MEQISHLLSNWDSWNCLFVASIDAKMAAISLGSERRSQIIIFQKSKKKNLTQRLHRGLSLIL